MTEREIIERIIADTPRSTEQVNAPFECDAEILRIGDELWAVSVDEFSDEDRFGADPRIIGWNAAVAAMSDLLAVGGVPKFFLHALCLPSDAPPEFIDGLVCGVRSALSQASCFLIGGDVGQAPSWRLCGTVLGPVRRSAPLKRTVEVTTGELWVTGTLGDANVAAATGSTAPRFELRLAESAAIRDLAVACIDTSGGFLGAVWDLHSVSSDVSIEIDLDRVPWAPSVQQFASQTQTPDLAALLGGAGEYELLFATSELLPGDTQRLAELGCTRVGTFEQSTSGRIALTRTGGVAEFATPPPCPRDAGRLEQHAADVIRVARELTRALESDPADRDGRLSQRVSALECGGLTPLSAAWLDTPQAAALPLQSTSAPRSCVPSRPASVGTPERRVKPRLSKSGVKPPHSKERKRSCPDSGSLERATEGTTHRHPLRMTPTTNTQSLSRPLHTGSLVLRNRIVRSATYEGLGDADGTPRVDELTALYSALAEGGVGGIVTGFVFVSQEGRAIQPCQAGIDDDLKRDTWREVRARSHECSPDLPVIMQLAHAGRQTWRRVTGQPVVGASRRPCSYFRGRVTPLDDTGIERVIADFARATRRAQEAGFDGVQLHAAHGYLIHQFLSPWTNTREDRWADKPLLLLQIIDRIRQVCGDDFPVWVKLSHAEDRRLGISIRDTQATVERLEAVGVGCVEISYGTMELPLNIIRGACPLRALYHVNPVFRRVPRLFRPFWHELFVRPRLRQLIPFGQGYNAQAAAELKRHTTLPVIAVGGFRSVGSMVHAVTELGLDAVSLCRPLIREPDLPRRMLAGEISVSTCTNCNLCTIHCDGPESVRCHRPPNNGR